MEASEAGTVSGPVGYGWLGAKERATIDATAGLTLMGVRLYNQATGSFTSTDPVPGGNSTAYSYPTDPINQSDLDGQKWNWKRGLRRAGGWVWRNKSTIVAGAGFAACMFASAGLCSGLALVGFGMSAHENVSRAHKRGGGWKNYLRAAGETSVDFVFTRVPALRITKIHRIGGTKLLRQRWGV